MKKAFTIINIAIGLTFLMSCNTDDNSTSENTPVNITFSFSHNWDGVPVSNTDFNTIQYTNANGEMLSIERLRYLISDITFTTNSNEVLKLNTYHLIDLTNANNLSFSTAGIPSGNYSNVSFTFGFNNDANSGNYVDLNSASFNVPEMLGGGYHYMQLDGKYINNSATVAGYNYHAIRAVDNPGANPTFPQDTFITVNLGAVNISGDSTFNIEMNIAEWFKNPNQWDLNQLDTVLMPNSMAQIMMFQNGQNVFSLERISQ